MEAVSDLSPNPSPRERGEKLFLFKLLLRLNPSINSVENFSPPLGGSGNEVFILRIPLLPLLHLFVSVSFTMSREQ
jgi:hypothetical protein